MDRPETIELVGQTLRWGGEVGQTLRWSGEGDWETARPNEGPRLSAYYSGGNECFYATVWFGRTRATVSAPTLETLDLALRAELAEVADAVAAWLPEREARIHADAAKMAMELAAQRNALSEAIDTVCGLDHELKSTGGAVPSNALDALRGWEARVRAEERERCVEACQDVEPYTADVHRCVEAIRAITPAVRT